MKAILILINWALSFLAILCLDMDHSSMWIVLFICGWFCGSSVLMNYAEKHGWMEKIEKRFKLDEL